MWPINSQKVFNLTGTKENANKIIKDHFLPLRLMKLYKEPTNPRCWRGCKEMVSLRLAEVQIGTDTLKSSLAVPTVHILEKQINGDTYVNDDKYKKKFNVVLIAIANIKKQFDSINRVNRGNSYHK